MSLAPNQSAVAFPATDAEPIAVVGAGYVGLVTGACLAATGRSVTLIEIDRGRREMIAQGEPPIYEPGLSTMLRRVTDSGALRVSADLIAALESVRMVVLAVGTPPLPDGRADLRALDGVAAMIAEHAAPDTVVVIKSTVPPGTGRRLQRSLDRTANRLHVVNCPEFLREGCAIEDVSNADRFVVGGTDEAAMNRVIAALNPFATSVVRTSNTGAELVKYGSNAFLAMKISFINEIANLCDLVGANIDEVALGMGLDPRICVASMKAGLGYGGSCFPKDVAALEQAARREGLSFWLLRSATEVNEQQRIRFVQKICAAVGGQVEGRTVALLGLAFKPGTDDLRQAPSIAIANRLVELGAIVVAHDPVAMDAARSQIPDVEFAVDPYEAVTGADVVAVVTEWPEYKCLDWSAIASMVHCRIVVDGRNCIDPELLAEHGFDYHGMGRPSVLSLSGHRSVDGAAAVSPERVA
ncbi:MAG: UDP-glucose dehydrogenase family protein [Jatrophihabitantaceae bacterium]